MMLSTMEGIGLPLGVLGHEGSTLLVYRLVVTQTGDNSVKKVVATPIQ